MEPLLAEEGLATPNNAYQRRSALGSATPTNGATLPRGWSSCILAEGISSHKREQHRKTQNILLLALAISFIFLIIEVAGGIYSHSLAILTDAAHMLSDVSGFGVSAFAAMWVTKRSGHAHSFGYHRIEVLGALASVLTVWLVTGVLIVEACKRLRNPSIVNGKVMFFLALIGLGVNLMLLWLLGGHHHGHSHSHGHGEHQPLRTDDDASDHHHQVHEHSRDTKPKPHDHSSHSHINSHESDDLEGQIEHGTTTPAIARPCSGGHKDHGGNINIRGAVIHALGDVVQSVGVAIAGALIWWHQDDPRWHVADPICTFLFAALVLYTTLSILRDIADILMERAPRGIEVAEVGNDLSELEGVCNVHDLHIWMLSPGIPLLAAHVEMMTGADATAVLHSINRYCKGLGIEHSTIQLVVNGTACPCAAVQT